MLQPTTLSLSSLLSPARGGGSPMATTGDFAMALAELSVLPPTEAATAPIPTAAAGAAPIRQDLAAPGNIVPIISTALTKVVDQPLAVVVPAPALDCAVEPERPALPDGLLSVAAPVASPDYRPTGAVPVVSYADPATPAAIVADVVVRAAIPLTPTAPVPKTVPIAVEKPGIAVAPQPAPIALQPFADATDVAEAEVPTSSDDTAERASVSDGSDAESAPAIILAAPPPALASVVVPPLTPLTITPTPIPTAPLETPAPLVTPAPAPIPAEPIAAPAQATSPTVSPDAADHEATASRTGVTVPALAETADKFTSYPRVTEAVALPAHPIVMPPVASEGAPPPRVQQQTRPAADMPDVRAVATPDLAALPGATLAPPTMLFAQHRPIPAAPSDTVPVAPVKAAAIAAPAATDCLQAPEPAQLPGEAVEAAPVAAVANDTPTPVLPAALKGALSSPAPVLSSVAAPLPPITAPLAPVTAPVTAPITAPVTAPPAPVGAAPVVVTPDQPAATIQPVAVASPADRPVVAPTSRARTTTAAAPIDKQPAIDVETRRPVGTPDMRVVALPPAPPPTPEVLPAAQMFAQAMFATPRAMVEAEDASGDALPIALLTLTGHPAGATTAPLAVQAMTAASDQAPLDLSRGEWMTTMIDRIETLRDESGAIGETRLKLAPDALGNVDVSVRRDDAGQYQVRISADTAPARTILAEAAPRLVDMAEARGLKLSHAGVDGGTGGNTGFTDSNRRDAPPSAMPPRRPASAANDGDAGVEPTIHTTRIA
ncbi:hypothetical protein ASE86_00720 [Sphingomonas sp. Leaf33]|uniref:flagellar hook-length control protein FliK n=1 Tax=Sphingomonas sp. Leaf33 TaxID=1736215 RepID=UPI0006FF4502|nr:flagellar hook-length control protein FliK [Sphingomonas sp. Leaf33]KQN24851.1 hypothetical protein ASE86_00720 [Sphingomonas sp. Leaf33]